MNDQNIQTITPAAPVDDRPWEPLNGNPVRVGDEVRMDKDGITRTGVVSSFDEQDDPWTADGFFIGPLDLGTWWVRRPAQDPQLPADYGNPSHYDDGTPRYMN